MNFYLAVSVEGEFELAIGDGVKVSSSLGEAAIFGRPVVRKLNVDDALTIEEAIFSKLEITEVSQLQNQLDGEWQIVFLDKAKTFATVLSDHFASYPVFWGFFEDKVVVSDCLAVIVDRCKSALNLDAVSNYLARGEKDDWSTLRVGVSRLMPGQVLQIDQKAKVSILDLKLWDTSISGEPNIVNLRQVILSSVNEEVFGLDHPIAGTISAGLDSTSVSLAASVFPNFKASSIKFNGNIEFEQQEIDATVTEKNLDHEYVLSDFSLDDLLEHVKESGEPVRDVHFVSTAYTCARVAAQKGAKSFLVGLGPDMYFAGAARLVPSYVVSLIRAGEFTTLFKSIARLARYCETTSSYLVLKCVYLMFVGGGHEKFRGKSDFPDHVLPQYAKSIPHKRSLSLKEHIVEMMSLVRAGNMLRSMERLAGLKISSPLYRKSIIDSVLMIDVKWFMMNGETKYLMRRALEGFLPHHITHADVKKRVPHMPIEAIVFDEQNAKRCELLLTSSKLLKKILRGDVLQMYRADRKLEMNAKFWIRCVQIAFLDK